MNVEQFYPYVTAGSQGSQNTQFHIILSYSIVPQALQVCPIRRNQGPNIIMASSNKLNNQLTLYYLHLTHSIYVT